MDNSQNLQFYREYRDSFIHMIDIEVRQSEQRIRFFLALVTGIVAIIGIIDSKSSSFFDPFWVAAISLPILLIYGLLTFSQVIWSSHVRHNLEVTKGILDELIKKYDPVFNKEICESDLRRDSQPFGLKNIKGTFAQYMYVTEGLLVAGFVFFNWKRLLFKYGMAYINRFNIFYHYNNFNVLLG